MRYVIMADGKGTRWGNYSGIPKHLIKIGDETLLERTVRLIKQMDESNEIVITSHDHRYEVEGAVRYEPKNNVLEIDRFTDELIDDGVVFLYGDTYYTDDSIKTIVESETETILFFGNRKSIVAVKVENGEIFRCHVDKVRRLFLDGKIDRCVGWQVYQSFEGLPFGDNIIADDYVVVEDSTRDFNAPEDLKDSIIL